MTVVVPRGGGLSDSAHIQEAVDAFGTGGGTVTLSGTYTVDTPIKLPHSNTATVTISGSGEATTRIELTATTPRLFVWNRTAEHQTFRKFSFEGFTVDAGNRHPATDAHYSVFGFDMQAGSGVYDPYYCNIENITLKDVTLLNVASSNPDPDVYNSCAVNISTTQFAANEPTADHITDIVIENVRAEGGMRGFQITGQGPSPGLNVWLDRISIRDCWHDTMVEMLSGGDAGNYHIGMAGRLGKLEITNCYGNRGADIGIEIDQASDGLVQDCVIENVFYNAYYYTNFDQPLTGAGLTTYDRCIARSTIPTYGATGFTVGNEGIDMGDIVMTDCVYDTILTGWRVAVRVPEDVDHLDSLTIDGLTIVAPNVSNPTQMLALRGLIGVKTTSGVVINGKAM